MLIEVNHLEFAFSDKPVFHDISFSIEKGDIFAILGPNGTGKTTLIRLLTGVLQPLNGSITINGISNSLKQKKKCMMGVTYPLNGVYLKMTGFEPSLSLEMVKGLNKASPFESVIKQSCLSLAMSIPT